MKRNKRTMKAFTLIELLVVIAIISLLAAILFPVFARARENAQSEVSGVQAHLQNNVRRLDFAISDERY